MTIYAFRCLSFHYAPLPTVLVADVFQKNHLQQNTFPVKAHCIVLDCIYRHALFLNLSNHFTVDFRGFLIRNKNEEINNRTFSFTIHLLIAQAEETKQVVLK